MAFDHDKRMALTKKDKSKKGTIDLDIKALCDQINSKKNYYTTSSCSGRIQLLSYSSNRKKNETEFLYSAHDVANAKELLESLHASSGEVWIRVECFILHVACRSADNAVALLNICRQLGLKRTGIISMSKKNIVEIINHPRIDAPMRVGDVLVTDSYVTFLVERGNEILDANRKMIVRLEREVKTIGEYMDV